MMVGVGGLEPPTPASQTRCAAICATPRTKGLYLTRFAPPILEPDLTGQLEDFDLTASIATTLDQWRLRHPKLAAPGKAILGIGVMVILFMAAQSWLRAVTHLAPTAYAGPIILTELAGATLRSLMGLAGLAAFGVALMFRGRQILRPWSAFEHGAALRPLLMGVIALAAWFVSAFDPNPYFHQTYTLDRALVIALALAACWRPGFLPAFLWLAYALLWQFDYPLPLTDAEALLALCVGGLID